MKYRDLCQFRYTGTITVGTLQTEAYKQIAGWACLGPYLVPPWLVASSWILLSRHVVFNTVLVLTQRCWARAVPVHAAS